MESFSLRYYLNKSKPVGDKFKIYGRVIVNRKKAEFYTNFPIKPNDWDEESTPTIKGYSSELGKPKATAQKRHGLLLL